MGSNATVCIQADVSGYKQKTHAQQEIYCADLGKQRRTEKNLTSFVVSRFVLELYDHLHNVCGPSVFGE